MYIIFTLPDYSGEVIERLLVSHIQRIGCQGRKTSFGRKERTKYSPFKEKAAMVQKILGKSDISIYSTGPLIRNTYFEQGFKTLLPTQMQAQFLNSPFLIASQEYCTYFLFPPFLVSSAVISSYFLRQSLLFSSPFCGRYHYSQDEFSLPVLPHLCHHSTSV